MRNTYVNGFVFRLEVQTNKSSCWNFGFVLLLSFDFIVFDTFHLDVIFGMDCLSNYVTRI